MARARNIKPGFFKNEDLAECSAFARLCFAGLWLLADREGRLEDRAKRIKGELFPFDSVDVEPLLVELERWHFIRRYQIGSQRFISIAKFLEHQVPHGTEKDGSSPDENGYVTVHERRENGYITGKWSLEPYALTVKEGGSTGSDNSCLTVKAIAPSVGGNTLNPESGFLTPDTGTLKPESGIQNQKPFDPPPAEDGSAPEVSAAKPAKVVKAKALKDELPTVGTWKAYAQAYEVRYRVEPVRNGTVNGKLANLVSRLGADEAPAVAAFYVRSNNGRYVASGHSVGMLVMDAEKLRTEWATGRQGTTTQAHQADKTATNLNAFAGLLAEAQAKDTHAQH